MKNSDIIAGEYYHVSNGSQWFIIRVEDTNPVYYSARYMIADILASSTHYTKKRTDFLLPEYTPAIFKKSAYTEAVLAVL